MHGSPLPLRKWVIAFYLMSTNLKGVSSMKMHRELGITQKTAWYMMHRIRTYPAMWPSFLVVIMFGAWTPLTRCASSGWEWSGSCYGMRIW